MNTIINTSSVTDYSGEPPIVTFSNPVTTVIRQPDPVSVITRIYYICPRNRCGNSCGCRCNNSCGCENSCNCFDICNFCSPCRNFWF